MVKIKIISMTPQQSNTQITYTMDAGYDKNTRPSKIFVNYKKKKKKKMHYLTPLTLHINYVDQLNTIQMQLKLFEES